MKTIRKNRKVKLIPEGMRVIVDAEEEYVHEEIIKIYDNLIASLKQANAQKKQFINQIADINIRLKEIESAYKKAKANVKTVKTETKSA